MICPTIEFTDVVLNATLMVPREDGCPTPLRIKLNPSEGQRVAIQLEEQGFGYGAFWCKAPTIREALLILWWAMRGKTPRTDQMPKAAPWAVDRVEPQWAHDRATAIEEQWDKARASGGEALRSFAGTRV